jgi:hypothetical protein
MNLIKQVRLLASKYTDFPKHVKVDFVAVDKLAKEMEKDNFSRQLLDLNQNDILKELVANSINYCYWYGRYDIKPGGGAGNMYKIVNEAFENNYNDLSSSISEIIKQLSKQRFPLLEQRIKHLLEVEALGENFVEYMVRKYKNDNIFDEFVETFPGYASDIFLKRASLFFLQLYRLGGWYRYIVENLFVPVDYQVPKMLEHFGCLNYSEELYNIIHSSQLIPAHSLYEIEIRASTILVCDLLAQNTKKTISDVDWWLWSKKDLCQNPFHLTETTDY